MTTETMDTVPTPRRGWLRESSQPPLVEVFRTIALPEGASSWRRFLAFVGPGLLEGAYEMCLLYELESTDFAYATRRSFQFATKISSSTTDTGSISWWRRRWLPN